MEGQFVIEIEVCNVQNKTFRFGGWNDTVYEALCGGDGGDGYTEVAVKW